MTEAMKAEALEQLEADIQMGFENEQELFKGIRDIFYDEDDFDEDWLKQMIAQKYQQHQKESLLWQHPTDFERLAAAFDHLVMQKIVCLHNAGYTKSDGEFLGFETIETLEQSGIKSPGFCYYHTQDLMRAIDPSERNLYLGFDSADQNDEKAITLAHKIVEVLHQYGFQTTWHGSVGERIKIENFTWQKKPDDKEWGSKRVIQILTETTTKKPFWKFW